MRVCVRACVWLCVCVLPERITGLIRFIHKSYLFLFIGLLCSLHVLRNHEEVPIEIAAEISTLKYLFLMVGRR